MTAKFIARTLLAQVADADADAYVMVEGVALPGPTGGAVDATAFHRVVLGMIQWYRRFIEQAGGGVLIIGDEKKAQVLFLAGAAQIAKHNDIDLSREVETGRGPVDFKASRGHSQRALVELKRACNSAYWNGLQVQLPTYLLAEDVGIGHFITIIESEDDKARASALQRLLSDLRARLPYMIQSHIVDARKRPSASKSKSYP